MTFPASFIPSQVLREVQLGFVIQNLLFPRFCCREMTFLFIRCDVHLLKISQCNLGMF